MDRRRLGKTNLQVSPVGFGAFKIGRNQGIKYAHGYELPDDDSVAAMLNGVLDAGINLIDTAPAYGTSEERIGKAIAHRRDEYVLVTKVGEQFIDGKSHYDFSRDAVDASIMQSLKRLKTSVIDLLLIHANADDMKILTQTDVVATMLARRDSGDVRFVGFSGKSPAAAQHALDFADVLMLEYHADDTTHGSVIDVAAERDVGILIKKGLASGRHDAAEALRFALQPAAVASVIVGSLSLEHMKTNLATARAAIADSNDA